MPKLKIKKTTKKIVSSKVSSVVLPSEEYFIVFEGIIDTESTARLYKAIQDGLDKNPSKIVIFFSSLGGNIYEGFLLGNVIRNSRIPILIHATNHIDSIANVVYLSAKERSAESHAKFYMHGSTAPGGDERALGDSLSAVKTNNSRIAYFISENTNLKLEEVKSMMGVGTTISAQEALQYAITSQVVHREISNDACRVEIIYIN